MRKLSLPTRAFLISFLPLCLVMSLAFIGFSVALKNRTRDGIHGECSTESVDWPAA